MTDLSDFLLARIAEDESAARALPPFIVDAVVASERIHFARWVPARVLAECEAKRRIVELHQVLDAHVRQVALTDRDQARDARNTEAGVHGVLTVLAVLYADHPDYQEEWRA